MNRVFKDESLIKTENMQEQMSIANILLGKNSNHYD